MIQLNSVTKTYRRGADEVAALRSTTLTIDGNDFMAIVGPSGSGKSTMLCMIGGMLAPTSGQIFVDGESLYDQSVARRCRFRNERVGFVFQSFNLVPWLTAVENVQLPLSLYGTPAEEQRQRAESMLARFGLENRLRHRPAELSAGQQQRVALARTLVTNPQLILADEPTGNLDPESRDLVLRTFNELHAEGHAVVLVTHDHHVSAAAQRVLRIDDGQVCEQSSGPSDVAA